MQSRYLNKLYLNKLCCGNGINRSRADGKIYFDTSTCKIEETRREKERGKERKSVWRRILKRFASKLACRVLGIGRVAKRKPCGWVDEKMTRKKITHRGLSKLTQAGNHVVTGSLGDANPTDKCRQAPLLLGNVGIDFGWQLEDKVLQLLPIHAYVCITRLIFC